jgi:flavin reductase (DIM6/NTAB) family NADH-FMN oxidoreductase RutF
MEREPDRQPISSPLFREVLAQFASGITIVTARTPGGLVGFTATGFTSASLTPPLVLVCVGKGASAHDGIVGADRFGVNVLCDHQGWIAEQFARSGVDRFRGVDLCAGSVPLIDRALAQLECRRYGRLDAGDHTILLGEVLEGVVAGGRPLVHFARRFGAFVAETGPRAAPAGAAVQKGETV